MSDKAHAEHIESAHPPIADMKADINFLSLRATRRRLVGTPLTPSSSDAPLATRVPPVAVQVPPERTTAGAFPDETTAVMAS
jgi:hypothetical protein